MAKRKTGLEIVEEGVSQGEGRADTPREVTLDGVSSDVVLRGAGGGRYRPWIYCVVDRVTRLPVSVGILKREEVES
jgi:hypothetical protein